VSTVHLDPGVGDDGIRDLLYRGDLVLFTPSAASLALASHARRFLEDAFAPFPPAEAQHHLPVERFVEIFAPVKPAFIHDPGTLERIAALVAEWGMDLAQWFLDVPRLRGVTSHGYLTAGVGYVHHPHRDTWYAAPRQQLNWWMALYPFDASAALAFHPGYARRAVANDSQRFDYYQWNANGRRVAPRMVTTDTRWQPRATEALELEPDLRLVIPPGAVLGFSGGLLHSTARNTSGRTRFSIDFRTVHLGDLRADRGAPVLDAAARGTSLRDFRRGLDLAPMPDDVVAAHDHAAGADGVLVFRPDPA
jgi:hypothetical protein